MIWIASTQSSPIAARAASRSFAFQWVRKRRHVVAEAGPGELVRVRVDDRVVQEILARELGVAVPVGHPAVHVREISASPPLRTCSTHHGTMEAGR